MTERINGDFVTAYTALNEALTESYGGILGYLEKAKTVRRFEKEGHPDFDRDIEALAAANARYGRLIEIRNVKTPVASEDDIDYLKDFVRRLGEGRDPIGSLAVKTDGSNPDARKYLPIEAEAREISRKVIHRKRRVAIASVAAAIATVALTLAVQYKKGRKL